MVDSDSVTDLSTNKGRERIPERNIRTTALVVSSVGAAFQLRDVVLDEVRDHEALVEMLYTGICHTVSPSVVFWLSQCLVDEETRHELTD